MARVFARSVLGWSAVGGPLMLTPLLAGSGPDTPQPDPILELLNTRVITASRTSMKANLAPGSVWVITREQIRVRRYRTLKEALADLPEFKLDDGSSYDTFSTLTVRGARGTNKLIVMLDGIRISAPANNPTPILEDIFLHFVKQIEVLYGPASALYGADAFSGVVNLITRGPGEREGVELSATVGQFGLAVGQVFARMKLPGEGSLVLGAHSSTNAQAELARYYPEDYAGVSFLRQGSFPVLGGGTRTPVAPVHPDYDNPILSNSLFAKFADGGFTATLFHRNSRIPSSTANRPDYSIYNDDVFLGNELTTLSTSYAMNFGSLESATTTSVTRHTLNPKSNYRNFWTGYEHGYKFARSSNARLDQLFTWRDLSTLELTGGFSVETQEALAMTPELSTPVDEGRPLAGKLLGTDLDALFYTTRDTLLGGFLQAQYQPFPEFILTAGLRRDRSNRYGSTWNPRAGIVWTPSEYLTFKFMTGQAFLAPSPLDSYAYWGAFLPDTQGGYFSYFMHLPNPDLKAQHLRTEEASLRILASSGLAVTLDLFRSRFHDLITEAPDAQRTNLYNGRFMGFPVGYIEVYDNLGSQKTYGGHLTLNYSTYLPDDLKCSAWASVSYVEGKVDTHGDGREEEIPNVAPWTYRIGADLAWGPWNGSLRFARIGAQRLLLPQPQDPAKRATMPGYSVWDLALGYQPTPHLELFLRVENALDARYRNISPGIGTNAIELQGTPQPPRRISGGIRWTF